MTLPAPPPPKPIAMCDTECAVNYWLCRIGGAVFELFDGHPLDIQGMARMLQTHCIYTFNGNHYDMAMITLALNGANNADLKAANDAIILRGVKPWEIARPPEWIEHIDLFEVAPGQGSLKAYGGKLHSRKLQDLPYDPSEPVTPERRPIIVEYCGNDLAVTDDLRRSMSAQIELRYRMSAEYGVNLMSKSDAQIAEACMRRMLAFKPQIPPIEYGRKFHYRPPQWVRFISLDVLAILARCPFTIGPNGAAIASDELDGTRLRIGNMLYQIGAGGLHSTEASRTVRSDSTHVITDHDVASYYPKTILTCGIYPAQIGPAFLTVYERWFNERMAAKHAGKKKEANSRKIVLNGTFGKLGSPWSIFYAPAELIQVTVTGQLGLLMLIEMLELCGMEVLSANTDGIIVRTRRGMEWMRDAVLRDWEQRTGYETEQSNYALVASRDVNSYIAIDTDGKAKLKGAYAPPDPGPSGWPNPTGQIVVTAVIEYLKHGTPLANTIKACTDVRQFVHVRAVKGGGLYAPQDVLPKSATLKYMREVCGDIADKTQLLQSYAFAQEQNRMTWRYLGKIVRWYYAADCAGAIVTQAGNHVATASGCKPLMELPDVLPVDIDYSRYVADAEATLKEIGSL